MDGLMRVEHIERRIEQQFILKDLIENAYTNLIKVGCSGLASHRVYARLDSLKENWERFSVIHDAITFSIKKLKNSDEITTIQSHSYFSENLFSITHESYLESVEKMTSLLNSDNQIRTGTSSTHSESQNSHIPVVFHHARLPRIDLPKFNGSPADWLSFKDLFSSLILANPTLTPVEKLQYLKTSLTGSASLLLKNTTLTADNFQKAWDALIAFYENKRLLVNAALHSLVTLKRMTKESANEMEQLYTSIMQIYRTLETLRRPVDSWDDFLVFIAVQRLDSESVKAWEHHLGSSKDPPTWKQFSEFLITRLLSLQAFEKSRTGKQALQSTVKSHFQGKAKESNSIKTISCKLCSANHYINKCPQYISKTTQQRLAVIAKHHLCYNCLGPHLASACRITKRCQKCGLKHHTTIHQAKENSSDSGTKKGDSSSTNLSNNEANVLHTARQFNTTMSSVFLATAQVEIIAPSGETTSARVLIDQGSEISLITERLAQLLRLPRSQSFLSLVGIGGKRSNKPRGVVFFKIRPHFRSTHEISMTAYILPKLTDTIPSFNIDKRSWPHLNGLQLADKEFMSPNSIDIILGADVYAHIIECGLVKGDENSPIAQETKLGWIISGPSDLNTKLNKPQSYHVSLNRDLHDLISRFWKLEDTPTTAVSHQSVEAQECEQHFITTHSRDAEGRYIVRLPFKQSKTSLGDSRSKALRIMESLSKKLKQDITYSQSYSAFMEEYESLNHMRRVPDNESEPQFSFYLPHHGVLRENSLTTKLRVVFNGSSISSTGLSLNDLLHTGEKLQQDLFDILIWFRQFRYVFSADVEKMFRQIKVHPEDWNFQRILWLDQSRNITTYQLTTVTYGLACAPFLALRTLNQLVIDEGAKYPLAVPILQRGRYVDDFFGGSDSIQHAREIVGQLDQCCKAGGFPLQKWISNNDNILDSIPADRRVNSSCLQIENTTTIQVLGLCWNPAADTFQFTINLSPSPVITKRSILSTIARLFDPLGLISPVIIQAKMLIQELWVTKVDWDDPLPQHLSAKWIKFVDQLHQMSAITFPRWLNTQSNHQKEIHGFCDASQKAISAVVYIRTTNDQGETNTRLICSKTKVAPLKRMTIPRLELTGAVILTKLISHILRILELANSPIFMWTDSAVTHIWINNHPSRWRDFVYNRVCYIQETLPQATWKFIPGSDNPADCASRGLSPSQLSEHSVWWTGPQWLSQSTETWPQSPLSPSNKDNLEERPIKVCVNMKAQAAEIWDLINKYSSLTRLLRVTSWCFRAIRQLRKQFDLATTGPITPQELENAKFHWVKITQQFYFEEEISILSKGRSLPRSNSLLSLTAFRDPNGLLRVGGRLHSSQLPVSAKHPLILPKKSALTSLVIADAHSKTLHGGTQATLTLIRDDYWIIGGRAPVRSFILKCVRCSRYRKKRAQQIMGQLPFERVTPSRPFLHAGVDYAGPILLKNWKGKNSRKYKAYIALFVCQATSALHLELVTDYSTEAFIAAFKRFTARRGICATLKSDCGTNFTCADSELKNLFAKSSKELGDIANLLANDGTKWQFNPPASPHFGGQWEAGVKSVKYHLKRIVGDTLLTYEEMNTLLVQVEAVLNSRPLTPLSNDPDDLEALTPGHFLTGSALKAIPEPSLLSVKCSHLSRWQLIQQMLESFWTRWSRECLQRHLAIYKWNKTSPSLQEGSLVLVVDERYPPTKWPLGRIIQTHPGRDGQVRVVSIRTQSSILKRPVVKIIPLPIST